MKRFTMEMIYISYSGLEANAHFIIHHNGTTKEYTDMMYIPCELWFNAIVVSFRVVTDSLVEVWL